MAAKDIFCNVFPCPRINGSFTRSFCCSEHSGGPGALAGCCDSTVIIDMGQGPGHAGAGAFSMASRSRSAKLSSITTALTLSETYSISSSTPASALIRAHNGTSASTISVSSLPVTATFVTQQSPPLKKDIEVGAAIGVTFGVFLLSSLMIFLVRGHRLRVKAQKEVIDIIAAYDESSHWNAQGKLPGTIRVEDASIRAHTTAARRTVRWRGL